jgi:hypothetical protein
MQRLHLVGGLFMLLTLTFAGPGCAKKESKEAAPSTQPDAPLQDSAIRKREKQAGGEGKPAEKPLDRKIIYTAHVRLITEEFTRAKQQLLQLVEDHKGHVIHSEDRGTPGTPRYGEWKIRVPVAKFKAFQEAVVKLGELQSSILDSQDVTEEFYDLQTRIKNRLAREQAQLQRYKEWAPKAQKPADLQPITNELDQLRLDIERDQGRLNVLNTLTEMTTVTVVIHERGAYVPPETATLGTKASRTFWDSLGALGNFGEGLLLVLIALVPWVPVIAVVALPIWLLVQRAKRAGGSSAAIARPVQPSGPAAPPPQQPA